MPERKRSAAGILDTAILVFVGLIAAVIAWKILASLFGTLLFFVKLFVLALVIAVMLRAWLWVRRRLRSRTPEAADWRKAA